jgi:transposase-like protein
MTKPLTTAAFFRLFPDDETCLQHLFTVRFGQGYTCPSCERPSNWYRIKAERAYSCQWCGHHLHPTVGTPFAKTRTPLQLWFYAIHLFTTTRHGVSGKELQRQLGVTYKTAWRMAALIREHMADVDGRGVNQRMPMGYTPKIFSFHSCSKRTNAIHRNPTGVLETVDPL